MLGALYAAPKAEQAVTIRGKLKQRGEDAPALETAEHKLITLEGSPWCCVRQQIGSS